jgi:hypothetical protein
MVYDANHLLAKVSNARNFPPRGNGKASQKESGYFQLDNSDLLNYDWKRGEIIMSKIPEKIFHTDELLRKHGMLVRQTGWDDGAKFAYVDWQTHKPVSKARRDAFEDEAKERCLT